MLTINKLAVMVAKIAGIDITIKHIKGPMGVRGRNSDNTRLREVLKWEPALTLEQGLTFTYQWIEKQVSKSLQLQGITPKVSVPTQE
jgi:nucleoside-diphosphate-sugar epimerase